MKIGTDKERFVPIFVHASWRTGSTYLWTKFRQQKENFAYYEPFHELLERVTAEMIDEIGGASWPSGHPRLQYPYFEEYRDLVVGVGVEHFKLSFAYELFFENASCLPDQKRYIERLVEFAASIGRRPVLNFCRSGGRLLWFRRWCPGIHIALVRTGLGMWRSASTQWVRYGNPYFLTMPSAIFRLARRDAWLTRYLNQLGLEGFPQTGDFQGAMNEARLALEGGSTEIPQTFAALNVLVQCMARRYADVTIDIECASNVQKRREVERRLRSQYGIEVDLADCSIPTASFTKEDALFKKSWDDAARIAEKAIQGLE